MCNLISSELFKIMKSKVTYVTASIFVGLAIIQMVVYKMAETMNEAIHRSGDGNCRIRITPRRRYQLCFSWYLYYNYYVSGFFDGKYTSDYQ